MINQPEHTQPVVYEIRVKGILDPSWADWFDGLKLLIQGNETIFIGVVTDQAALFGFLARINELGLSLISVNQQPQPEQVD